MGIRLSRIKGETRTATVGFGEEGDLTITFRPGVITPLREEELAVEQEEGRGVRAVVTLLTEVIVEWDLLDDNGVPLPLDADVLMNTLPVDVLILVLDAIKQVNAPGEASGAT